MRFRTSTLCATLLLAVPLLAREKTDVVVLENGDRITGEIKGLQTGVLKVSLDWVDGSLSVQWSKVTRVESSQSFLVETQDGSVYTGVLSTTASSTNRPVRIEVADEAGIKATEEKARVVRLEETGASFRQRLSGVVNLGSSYSKGNNATVFSAGSDIEFREGRWGSQLTYNGNLTGNSGAATATRNQLRLGVYRVLRRKTYFYTGLAGFFQSSTQGIDRQTEFGGAVGRYFKNTNRVRLSAAGGAVWQRTDYQAKIVPVARQDAYGALAIGQLQVYFFKKTNLTFTGAAVPVFSDPGRIFYETNASYYLKLFGNFSWDFSFYGNWDTHPPPTFKGSDYGYTSGLKWTFGYK